MGTAHRSVTLGQLCLTGAAILLAANSSPELAGQQVQVVRSTGAGVWGDGLQVVEQARIGAVDGPPEQTFGEVQAVTVALDGNVYVADGQVPAVRVYNRDGRFLRNVGREGEGPGEYRSLWGLRSMADSGVAVWDVRNGRITVFDPRGEVRDTHSFFTGRYASDIFQVDHAGRFYVRASMPRGDAPSRRQPEGWIRLSASGQVMDTISIPEELDRAESFSIATPSGLQRPFVVEIVSAMSPLGYLITGRTDGYTLDLHRSGQPLRIQRDYTPLRVSGEEGEEWRALARYFESRSSTEPSTSSERYVIPEVKPAFRDLHTDSEGRIWVRRYVPARQLSANDVATPDRPRLTLREPPTFDLFEPDGRFLGTVTLPMNARFRDARGRDLWATVTGQFDETYVVRYRIEGPR